MKELQICDCAEPEKCAMPKPPLVCRRLAGPPIMYHQMPKVGECEHEWDRQNDPQHCVKCGLSFTAHAFMEMP